MRPSCVRMMPTTVDNEPTPVHESCLRAYHILEKVKYWLKSDTPAEVLLELIQDMESGPGGSFRK